jgi:hypothetical protein
MLNLVIAAKKIDTHWEAASIVNGRFSNAYRENTANEVMDRMLELILPALKKISYAKECTVTITLDDGSGTGDVVVE